MDTAGIGEHRFDTGVEMVGDERSYAHSAPAGRAGQPAGRKIPPARVHHIPFRGYGCNGCDGCALVPEEKNFQLDRYQHTGGVVQKHRPNVRCLFPLHKTDRNTRPAAAFSFFFFDNRLHHRLFRDNHPR